LRFINHLLDQGLLDPKALDEARRLHGRREKKILRELTDRSVLEPRVLIHRMSEYYGLPAADLHEAESDAAALRLVPFEIARRHGIFPVRFTDGQLTVAFSDPVNVLAMDDLRARCGCLIERVLASEADIQDAIEKHYRLDEHLERAVKEMSDSDGPAAAETWPMPGLEDIHSPVSRTVRRILENAVQLRASDIHFEPQEDKIELRYRIDGDLTTVQTLATRHGVPLVARIKIISGMDIAEQRKPQDGRGRLVFRGRKVDLRISTVPTLYGEKVVIRLLNQDSLAVESLEDLGFDPTQREAYSKAIASKQGIVLVTGPTGSGKTTTLYASLNKIKCGKRNITTIEDPVEYLLTGVNQTQIHPKIGVTFPTMLRSILRQDPDVILVGEVRDRETADIAFRGSLTGHLVFSTLHTNSALGAVTRLFDLGLEPYLVSSALLCVVGQRLVHVICPDCREAYDPDPAVLEPFRQFFGDDIPPAFYRGCGCNQCSQTGFRGRTAILEVLPVTDELRSAIAARATEETLFRKAKRLGFKTMGEAALEKASEGVIPLEEALALMPAYEKTETDTLSQLADFIDAHKEQRLLVVKNEELIRKILLHTAPQDYALIEAATPEPSSAQAHVEETHLLGTSSNERRSSARITRDILVKYHEPGPSEKTCWETVIAKNLSVDGCYFRADRGYDVGQELSLKVQLPISRQSLPVTATVRHCQKMPSGEGFHLMGVSFGTLAPKGRSDLRRVVEFFSKPK